MSFGLLKRLSMVERDHSPGVRRIAGEMATKTAKALHASMRMYLSEQTEAHLEDVNSNIESTWLKIFDIDREVAPHKKFELAEELLLRPDIIKLFLVVFRDTFDDYKMKIRDLVRFIYIWTSNESHESIVSRRNTKMRQNIKLRDHMYYARHEVVQIIAEGLRTSTEARLFNDILSLYVLDDACLPPIFEDKGLDEKEYRVRDDGCIWMVLARLGSASNDVEQYDCIFELIRMMEILLTSNFVSVRILLDPNWNKFTTAINKLLVSANIYIQMKSFQIIYEILHNFNFCELRNQWLSDPTNFRIILINIQNRIDGVKSYAIMILEMFLMNPNNDQRIIKFIESNTNQLIQYFNRKCQFNPNGTIDQDCNELYSRILKILYRRRFNPRPLTKEQSLELEKMEERWEDIYNESLLIKNRVCGDGNESKSTRVYAMCRKQYLRTPIVFGRPGVQE